MKVKRVLFLGYKKKDTKLIKFLRNKNIIVFENGQKPLNARIITNYDFVISFGYNKKIKDQILKRLYRPAVNLHLSYLPYNKGSDPNYWSFKKKTPSGVSIHEIDENLDTGNIMFRKKIKFKNIKNLTLKKSYWILRKEIQKLFILNYKKILDYSYKSFKPREKGSFHKRNDLPKNISWNLKVTKL